MIFVLVKWRFLTVLGSLLHCYTQAPGRVTIAAAKSMCYTPDELTIDNYHGSIAYSNSFFFEGPPVVVTQRGQAAVNITFWQVLPIDCCTVPHGLRPLGVICG